MAAYMHGRDSGDYRSSAETERLGHLSRVRPLGIDWRVSGRTDRLTLFVPALDLGLSLTQLLPAAWIHRGTHTHAHTNTHTSDSCLCLAGWSTCVALSPRETLHAWA